MGIQFMHRYEDIIAVENLLAAWNEFIVGKRERTDVQVFAHRFMGNILALHRELSSHSYRHGGYEEFKIHDPKPRHIHKASVRDRLVHHAIYRMLCPFFDRTFIADSFSCRLGKGTHKALDRFRAMAGAVSRNHTRTCWVLKCDIQRFFASIDHAILMEILGKRMTDSSTAWLLKNVVQSFSTLPGVGLPLGNLTSQLFANVFMNEFDQFVKHQLQAHWYIRYADDFVMLSEDRDWLASLIPSIRDFLYGHLRLTLHPKKISLQTFASGVDFLGWVHFSTHRVLRASTKRRMLRRIQVNPSVETLQSYLGLLGHGNTVKLQSDVIMQQWLFRESIERVAEQTTKNAFALFQKSGTGRKSNY